MIKQSFGPNINGRDFVIGDLHGQIHLLDIFLNFINFDPSKDRVFSVGDLIDRGAKSFDSLLLIEKPWFHSVKANHEQLMEDFLTGGPTGMWWDYNGGGWFRDIPLEFKKQIGEELLPQVQELPWLITVNNGDGSLFHIIHAEFSTDWAHPKITDAHLENEKDFLEIAAVWARDGHSLLWGRNIFGPLYGQEGTDEWLKTFVDETREDGSIGIFNPDLSHIYSGHTIMTHPTTICGQTNLDTGAFLVGRKPWAGLTITEPFTNRFWKVSDDVVEVKPRILL